MTSACELLDRLSAALDRGEVDQELVEELLGYLERQAQAAEHRRRGVGVASALRSEHMHRAAREALCYVRDKWPGFGRSQTAWKARLLLESDPKPCSK